jgi:hypothetical protein
MSLLTAFDELTVNDHREQSSEPGEHVESSTSSSPVLNSGVDTHVPFSLSDETKEDHFQEISTRGLVEAIEERQMRTLTCASHQSRARSK